MTAIIYSAGDEPRFPVSPKSLMIKEIKEIKRLDFFTPSSEQAALPPLGHDISADVLHPDLSHVFQEMSPSGSCPSLVSAHDIAGAPSLAYTHPGSFYYDWRTVEHATTQAEPNRLIADYIRELSLQVVHNPPSKKQKRERMWVIKAQVNWQDGSHGKLWDHKLSAKLAPASTFMDFCGEVMNDYAKRPKEDREALAQYVDRIAETVELGEWQAYGLLQRVTGGAPAKPRSMMGFCGVRFHGKPKMTEPDLKNHGEMFVWLDDAYWRVDFKNGAYHAPQFYWKAFWCDGSKKTQWNNGPKTTDADWE